MISYLLFIAGALLLFMAFRVLRYVSYRIALVRKLYPILVSVELGLWIAFLFYLVTHFLGDKGYYNELVLLLVVIAAILLVWFYLKDVVAGFLFRIKHNPVTGQIIKSPEATGVIKMMTPSQMMVEEEGRNIVRVPYARVLGKSLSIEHKDIYSASEVKVHLGVESTVDFTNLENKIRIALLQSPWCVANKPIRIKPLTAPTAGVEITLHLVDKSFLAAVKERLTSSIGG